MIDRRRYRWTELRLLILPTAFVLVGMLELLVATALQASAPGTTANANLPPLSAFIPAFGLIAALFATHIALTILAPDADQTLLPIAGMLSGIGVLMALRLGPDLPTGAALGTKQLAWVTIGLVCCVATVRATRSLRWVRNYKYTWALVGIVLVGITLVHAHNFSTNAPSRDVLAIGSGGLSFQPSELLKICLVVFFAGYLSENREMLAAGGLHVGPFMLPPLKHLGPLLVMLGIALLLFIGVRELGLAILIFGLFLSMLYVASGRLMYVMGGIGLFALGAVIGLRVFTYASARVDAVTNAFLHASTSGYQVVQGLIALASGGLFGDGFGLGSPTVVPASNTDFIATSFGEEFGFAGLLALLGLFMLLVYRGMHVAASARDTFNQLMAVGLTAVFALQTLVILAGNLKIMPLTGVPLPFVAYGGSSVIANFIIIGLLLRLSEPAVLEDTPRPGARVQKMRAVPQS